MQSIVRFTTAAVLTAALALGGLCLVPAPGKADLADVSAVSCPIVRLKHWQSSGDKEKLSFLFGIASMLEMEREWQNGQPLPVSRSIVQPWVKALSGKTLGQIAEALDAYIKQYPDRLEEPVLKALGELYVRDALSPKERQEAGARYRQVKELR